MLISLIVFTVFAYLLGSLSSAVIVSKIFGLPDPRNEGSGNPGATNVLRIGGKKPALMVLLGDFLKGLIPVTLARMVGLEGIGAGIVALATFGGHVFPLFFNFRGGKGVATSIGSFIALSPLAGLLLGAGWIGMATYSRYSSLASLSIAILAPIVLSLLGCGGYFIPGLLFSCGIIWRHRANIQRLRTGTESKISW